MKEEKKRVNKRTRFFNVDTSRDQTTTSTQSVERGRRCSLSLVQYTYMPSTETWERRSKGREGRRFKRARLELNFSLPLSTSIGFLPSYLPPSTAIVVPSVSWAYFSFGSHPTAKERRKQDTPTTKGKKKTRLQSHWRLKRCYKEIINAHISSSSNIEK